MKLSTKQKTILVFAVIAVLGTLLTATAVSYYLTTSSPVTVTVTNGVVNIPVILTASSTAITDLDTLTLTATITNVNGNGKLVNFYKDGMKVGETQTFLGLTASVTIGSLAVGSYSFTAGP